MSNISTNYIEKFIFSKVLGETNAQSILGRTGFTESAVTELTNAIVSLGDVLKTESQMYGELIPSITPQPLELPDVTEMSADLSDNPLDSFIVNIERQHAESMLQGVENAVLFTRAAQLGYVPRTTTLSKQGVTLTSANGLCYELVIQDDLQLPTGESVLLSTNLNPVDISDAFIYKVDGQYYINHLIKQKGFFHGIANEPDTLRDYVLDLLDWANVASISDDVLSQMVDLAAGVTGHSGSTIFDNLELVANFVIPDYDDTDKTILEICSDLWVYYKENNPDFGVQSFYPDVLSSVMTSDTINGILANACDMISGGKFSISAFRDMVHNTVDKVTPVLRRLIDGCCNAFSVGGIYGVAKYIITFVKEGISIKYLDESGKLVFTENKNLVPAEYIGGIIGQLLGSAASVVSKIGSLFFRVVQYAGALVGGLIAQIPASVVYDYTQESYARVIGVNGLDDSTSRMAYFPHGLYQQVCRISDLCDPLKLAVESGFLPFYVEVPGGIIIIGPDSDPEWVRCELHLAICDYDFTSIYPGEFHNVNYSLTNTVYFTSTDDFIVSKNQILNINATAKPLNLNFDGNGYINDNYDDFRLKLAFYRSFTIFYCYYWMLSNAYSDMVLGGFDRSIIIAIPRPMSNQYRPFGMIHNSGAAWETGFPSDCNLYNFNPVWFLVMDNSRVDAAIAGSIPGLNEDVVISKNLIGDWTHMVNVIANGSNAIWNSGSDYHHFIYSAVLTCVDNGEIMTYDHVIQRADNFNLAFSKATCFINDTHSLPISYNWLIQVPKYNRSTFNTWVFVTILTAVAVTVTVVVSSIVIRTWIKRMQARNAAAVEDAWSNYTKDRSEANAKAYRKAVGQNNLFATFTGGTKYSKVSYWADTSGGDDGEKSSLIDEVKNKVAEEEQGVDAAQQSVEASEAIDTRLTTVNDTLSGKIDSISDKADTLLTDTSTIKDTNETIYESITGSNFNTL